MARTIERMLALAALAAASHAASAAGIACHADSGPRTTALIELYTSEGCDSCPPADRWLARNVAAGVSGDTIALAFHVDYWDRLGWKDRFATAAYTERQYDAMRMNGGRFVYTPQVLLGGHDFGDWRSGTPSRAIGAINARPARAKIALDATLANDRVAISADAVVDKTAGARKTALAIALVDSGLVSDVKAGENRGVRLSHDYVVRDFSSSAIANGASAHTAVEWRLPKEAGHSPTVVAFVQDTSNGDVLQALALPLAGCSR
jgi:hypothetical protein